MHAASEVAALEIAQQHAPFFAFARRQRRCDGRIASTLRVDFIGDAPVRGQAHFGRERLRKLDEKRIERADAETLDAPRELAEVPQVTTLPDLALQLLVELARARLTRRSGRQPAQDAREDLARRLAREGRREHLVVPHAVAHELQVVGRELERLAGAGRREEQS
jgi:hypothetical protein